MNHDPHALTTRLRIEFAQASDPGRDPNKQVNEDSCGYAETRFGHLAVLCDGMGGHYGGKEASRTAITTIFELFEQLPPHTTGQEALKLAIEEAGRRVYQLGGPPDNRARPGSTVVAMLLSDRGLDVAHVGDSRAYIVRSNQIYPLTRDHSMVQAMIDAGMLTEETAMGHPDSNKITRALGMRPDVDVELRPETMELFAGDLLLQSSDGLTDLALGRDILGCARQALSSGSVDHACNMLVRMANDRGGHDNITVQIVRVVEVAPKGRATVPDRHASPGAQAFTPSPASTGASARTHTTPEPTAPMPAVAPAVAPSASWGAAAPTMQGIGAHAASAGFAAGPAGAAATPSTPATPATSATPAPPAYSATPVPGSATSAPRPTLSDAQSQAPRAAPTAAWAATAFDPGGAGAGAISAMAGAAGTPQAPAAMAAAYGATPQPPGALPHAGPAAYPGAMGAPAPLASAASAANLTVSRGGIVYVILGLSGVIAVLLLVVIWALWLRS